MQQTNNSATTEEAPTPETQAEVPPADEKPPTPEATPVETPAEQTEQLVQQSGILHNIKVECWFCRKTYSTHIF